MRGKTEVSDDDERRPGKGRMTVAARWLAPALAAALSGCGIGGPAHEAAGPDARIVTMGFRTFEPQQITIRPGETVEFRNTSIVEHTVTADPRLAGAPANVVLPPGVPTFHSGEIAAGEVFRYTFEQPGFYRYVCLPHETDGMIGTVVVSRMP